MEIILLNYVENSLLLGCTKNGEPTVLVAYIFETVNQLNIVSEKWQDQYNETHPHKSLEGMTPATFKYSRRKVIEAYESVKAKMNGSYVASLDRFSTFNLLDAT